MGHRNPQGVFYDKKEDIIYSTEHGPQGGDEINININPNPNNIKNYGWGISSYGEHYGADEGTSEKCKNNSDLSCEVYKERLYISLIVLMDLRNLLNILPLQLASLKF